MSIIPLQTNPLFGFDSSQSFHIFSSTWMTWDLLFYRWTLWLAPYLRRKRSTRWSSSGTVGLMTSQITFNMVKDCLFKDGLFWPRSFFLVPLLIWPFSLKRGQDPITNMALAWPDGNWRPWPYFITCLFTIYPLSVLWFWFVSVSTRSPHCLQLGKCGWHFWCWKCEYY